MEGYGGPGHRDCNVQITWKPQRCRVINGVNGVRVSAVTRVILFTGL